MSERFDLAAFVSLPAGRALVGSTEAEVDAAVDYWSDRVPVNSDALRSWFRKEIPAHPVPVSAAFIMRFPFTPMVVGDGGSSGHDHPVLVGSPTGADELLRSIRRTTGVPFRLPSEAEWEWAARADTRAEYPWGSTFDTARCNTAESGRRRTTPVWAHPRGASAFGVEDMAGNVEEWTRTSYAPHPGGEAVVDGLASRHRGDYRVCKGGSYIGHGDLARVARRHGLLEGHGAYGFRLIVDAGDVPSAQAARAALLHPGTVRPMSRYDRQ